MTIETDQQKLIIKSKQEEISKVESFVEEILKQNQVSEENYGNIFISVIEGVNNAMNHGNNNDESKDIVLSYYISENKKNIVFKIKDEGPGFDYNNLPDPTALENLEKLGGRGVFLMKQLADMVIFENNGATVELSFRI
ncbi:MAG: ATP-binding protein [Bacteroidota bacterium]